MARTPGCEKSHNQTGQWSRHDKRSVELDKVVPERYQNVKFYIWSVSLILAPLKLAGGLGWAALNLCMLLTIIRLNP
jgi:hypothetical protein